LSDWRHELPYCEWCSGNPTARPLVELLYREVKRALSAGPSEVLGAGMAAPLADRAVVADDAPRRATTGDLSDVAGKVDDRGTPSAQAARRLRASEPCSQRLA
jgi:hypothetical protein